MHITFFSKDTKPEPWVAALRQSLEFIDDGQRYLLQAEVGALRAPALVLWGGADRVFDASGAAVLAGLLPGAKVEVLPGLGHLPMMEAPAEVASRYARFLTELR